MTLSDQIQFESMVFSKQSNIDEYSDIVQACTTSVKRHPAESSNECRPL